MKIARFVLKIVGASLMLAGLICAIIGCWDKLMDFFTVATYRRPVEYDDFADVD